MRSGRRAHTRTGVARRPWCSLTLAALALVALALLTARSAAPPTSSSSLMRGPAGAGDPNAAAATAAAAPSASSSGGSPASDPPGALRDAAAPPLAPEAAALPGYVHVASRHGVLLEGARVCSLTAGARDVAFTDGRGEAVIPRPEPGAPWHVEVDAPGHFHWRSTCAGDDDLWVLLDPTGPLGGLTRDALSGAPLAGAVVELVHDTCVGCAPDVATSDAEGRFRLAAVPLGTEVTLRARRVGYGDLVTRVFADERGGDGPFVLALTPTSPVEVAVLDAATSAPVAGAAVSGAAVRPGGPRTGADGVVSIDVVPPTDRDGQGRVEVLVTAGGYVTSAGSIDVGPPRRARVPLLPGATLSGTVRRPNGTPVAGAKVTAADDVEAIEASGLSLAGRTAELPAGWTPSVDPRALVTTTDDDGRFELRGLWPRSRYEVTVEAFGSTPVTRSDIATNHPGTSSNLALVVPGAGVGTWRGRVLYDGRPVEATLQWSSPGGSGQGRTDASGVFCLEGLPALPISLEAKSIRRTRGEAALRGWEWHDVPAGGVLERDVDVRGADGEDVATSGLVVAPDGAPLGGAWVTVESGLLEVATVTDERGLFSLLAPSLPGWRYTFTAELHGQAATVHDVVPGSSATVIVLPRTVLAEVEFRTVGEAHSERRWRLEATDWTSAPTVLAATGDPALDPPRTADGRFVVRLPEGRLGLAARIPRTPFTASRALEAKPGVRPRLRFEFPERDEVTLTFDGEGDAPRSAAVVLVPTDASAHHFDRARAGKSPGSVDVSIDPAVRVDETLGVVRIGASPPRTVVLRRGVDYHLVPSDPRISFDPPLLRAADRDPRGMSRHRLLVAD